MFGDNQGLGPVLLALVKNLAQCNATDVWHDDSMAFAYAPSRMHLLVKID